MKTLQYIINLYRPRTLLLIISPIILSHVLAFLHFGHINFKVLLLIIAPALLIQMATNAHNDVKDFEKGADTDQRLGPPRMTAQGLLSVRFVKILTNITFALAFVLSAYLFFLKGDFIILITFFICMIAGISYTSGPYPIAYSPLGEIFVIIFFGLVAVGISYYLQTQFYSLEVFILSLALGLLAANVLIVNNYRDADTDAQSGKMTLTVRAGRPFILKLFRVFQFSAFALVALDGILSKNYFLFGIFTCMPIAFQIFDRLKKSEISAKINQDLGLSVKYQMFFTMALCLLLIIGRVY